MLWHAGRGFVVRDLPWTVEKLRVIPPFEFENWAVIALGTSRTRCRSETWAWMAQLAEHSSANPKPAGTYFQLKTLSWFSWSVAGSSGSIVLFGPADQTITLPRQA